MTSFTNNLDLRYLKKESVIDGKWFMLLDSFDFYYNVPDTKKKVVITAYRGHTTDFATIPKALRWIVSPIGPHGKAAVIHDLLCDVINAVKAKTNTEDQRAIYDSFGMQGVRLTRKVADDVFLAGMKVLKVNRFKRRIMYRSVRAYSIVSGKGED